eukprot:3705601-Amphidinium_carterae.1
MVHSGQRPSFGISPQVYKPPKLLCVCVSRRPSRLSQCRSLRARDGLLGRLRGSGAGYLVALLALPSSVLPSLTEAIPQGEEALRFSAFFPGAHPSTSELPHGVSNLADVEQYDIVVRCLQQVASGEKVVSLHGGAAGTEEIAFFRSVEMDAAAATTALTLHASALPRRPVKGHGAWLGI